jgi:hypothetical protein
MGLAEKMFSRSSTACPLRSDCKNESNKRYFASLFEKDWEVFVIKRDNGNDKFDWFTLCCEEAHPTNVRRNIFPAACC